MLQGWRHKVVTILLYQDCIGLVGTNFATSLIISTRLLQVVNSLFQTCWQLGTSSANTTCWRLVGRLATRCETFTRVGEDFLSQKNISLGFFWIVTISSTWQLKIQKKLRKKIRPLSSSTVSQNCFTIDTWEYSNQNCRTQNQAVLAFWKFCTCFRPWKKLLAKWMKLTLTKTESYS
jgi:hypothetical protein